MFRHNKIRHLIQEIEVLKWSKKRIIKCNKKENHMLFFCDYILLGRKDSWWIKVGICEKFSWNWRKIEEHGEDLEYDLI